MMVTVMTREDAQEQTIAELWEMIRGHEARAVELMEALRDCTAFVAIHVDRWTRDNGGKMHETHRELLDRIGRLTGRDDLLQRLAPRPD